MITKKQIKGEVVKFNKNTIDSTGGGTVYITFGLGYTEVINVPFIIKKGAKVLVKFSDRNVPTNPRRS